MSSLTSVFVFSLLLWNTSTCAQDTSLNQIQNTQWKSSLLASFKENRIVVSKSPTGVITTKLKAQNKPIKVSGTVIKEVETAVNGLYNIQNRVINIKIGSRRRDFLDLTSQVGIKGWETKATGVLSKKRNASFDINYRFSIEDLLMNGSGHRLMLITNF